MEKDEFYISSGDTGGLIKEFIYRHKSGFHRRHGGRMRHLIAIWRSLFIRKR